MNKFCFAGKLGRDLEIRVPQSGSMIGEVSVALNDYAGQKDGKPHYYTTWVNLVIRGENRVLALQDQLWKGRFVTGSGRLANRPYKVNEEKSVTMIYIEVDDIEFDRNVEQPVPQAPDNQS